LVSLLLLIIHLSEAVGAKEAGGGARETRAGKVRDAAEKGQARAKRHCLL